MMIGAGERPNYLALLVFLAGMVLAGMAIYGAGTGGRSAWQTIGALLLTSAGSAMVAVRKKGVR
jgi:hypothetical protein